MFKKVLSMLMAISLLASMMSVSAFAAEVDEPISAELVDLAENAQPHDPDDSDQGDMIVLEKVSEDEVPEEFRQKYELLAEDLTSGAEGRGVGDNDFYERESNNSRSYADRVYHDYTIHGSMSSSVDVDYFKFVLSSSCYVDLIGVCSYSGMNMAMYSGDSTSSIGSKTFVYNSSSGLYRGGLYGTISAGTYYIRMENLYGYLDTYMLYLDAPRASSGSSSGGSTPSAPSTPSSVSVYGTAEGVTVSWDIVSGASYYRVYRSTNGSSWGSYLYQTSSGNVGGLIDNSVKHGTGYYYAVSAVSSAGESSKSSAKYINYTISAPTNVKATATESAINVTWNAVEGASRYAVYRSINGGDYNWVAGVDTNSYTDTKMTDGKTYSYKVACYNPGGSGTGAQSSAASATYKKPVTTLPAPTGVAAKQSGTAIEVTWNAVSGASRYAVYRSVNGGAYNWVAGVYTNSYSDTKMTDGSSYSYKVACYNTTGSGCGSQSVAASATYKKPVTKLPAPTGLSTESTEEGLKLTWTAVPNAERYAVYMSTDGVNYKWLSGPYTNSYVDTAIKNGETRFYKLACYNLGASGVGAYSGVVWGTYEAPEVELIVPAKPYKIANVVSGVHVYWKATAGADKYGLWRSETGRNGTYKWVANPTVPHFTDTKVESGKTYFYKVTSMDVQTDTHSDRSEPIGIAYTYTPDITSRENTAQGMKLGWQKIDGATGYAIYRKTYSGGDDWVRITTIDGVDVLSWTDTSVADKNGDVYKYTIRALHGTTLSGCRAAGRTVARVSSVDLGGANKAGADSVMTFWTKNEKATGYEIRFVSNAVTVKTENVAGADSVVKNVSGLTSGKTYSVQVRAYITVEGVGSFYSDWSAAKNVTL